MTTRLLLLVSLAMMFYGCSTSEQAIGEQQDERQEEAEKPVDFFVHAGAPRRLAPLR